MVAHVIPIAERIKKYREIDPDSGCWNWTGFVTSSGYGQMKVNGKRGGAHRASYEHFVGPIPDGLQIDHLCRNRRCVNPDHLEAVTAKVNIERSTHDPLVKFADYYEARRSRTTCKNGHPWDDENTRRNAEQRFCRTCRREATRAYRARKKALSKE